MDIVQILLSTARAVLIIAACLLMSIGFADIIVGIRGRIWRKNKVCLFAVIAVKEIDNLEGEINSARTALEKSGVNGEILLVDNGADDAAKELCSRFYGDVISESEMTDRILEEIKRR